VWLFNLKTLESRNVTDDPASDDTPMWHGRTLYFLSDRGPAAHFNLWSYSLDNKSFRQVTHFADTDIHAASAGPADLVFEAGGQLHLLNFETGEYRPVNIEIVTDLATLKPSIKNVGKLVRNVSPSPTGKRVAVEARGELFSVPAEHGPIFDLTQTSGIAERHPAWSPDGKQIAYWTDRSGEAELAVRPAETRGEETILTSFGPGLRYELFWSPDSKRIAFIDNEMTIWICAPADKSKVKVDDLQWLMHRSLDATRLDWSPDSRWLAYSRTLDNDNAAIWLFDTKSSEKHQVTSGFYSDRAAVFDPDGKYLYLLTDREMTPIFGALDEDMWVYANPTRIAAVALRNDVPSPLAARNDTEADEDKKDKKDDAKTDDADKSSSDAKKKDGDSGKDDGDKTADKTKEKKKEPSPVNIDLDNFERRLVVLPPEAGNYGDLHVISGKVLYLRQPDSGSSQKKSRLAYFDLKERKEETILDDVDSLTITADRKKLLVSRKEQYAMLEPKKDQKFEKPLPFDKLEMQIDPRAEWKQIFSEAWRLNRDFFYDPNIHGLDWSALRMQYGRLLDDAVTRWDVNFIIGELIGELNASHTRGGGGDTEPPRSHAVGMLGIDWSLENGAYRIETIIRGAPWDHQVRSPLDEPGLKVKQGDYILAVNRRALDVRQDPWTAFEGLEKQTVALSVNEKPSFDGAHEILVETLSNGDESALRELAWMEANRRRVEQASNGRIGYIYMPDTSMAGQNNLMRQFKAQWQLPGLVIDERFNSGGRLADRFLELLDRRSYAYLAWRHGKDQQLPPVAHFGPQVMLINGWSGSGGDAFPWYFRTAKRGPLIGTRTWGGLIGPAMGHELVDGGMVIVPPCRLYGSDGKWFAEGRGVEPDIEVVEDPSAMARGVDVQLERAIQEVEKRLLDGSAPRVPSRPAYERR
jgi:tricorn protease